MMKMSIRGGAVCAVVGAALVRPAFAQIAPADLVLETQEITGQDGNAVTVDYGSIEVPENRADPNSRMITIAFVRGRSHWKTPGTPVFVLAGGPGGSGLNQVEGMLRNGGQRFLDLLGGDVVGIDQRGVGRSVPNLESDARYGFATEAPGDRARDLEVIRRVCQAEAARWREQGVDLTGYNTVESADDINAVRAALDYPMISLWGGSYGSHLGMATIRRHGATIERALLTGPEGPAHTFKLPGAAQSALEKIGALVAADEELGALIPDLVGMLRDVLSGLEAEPVFVDVDGTSVGISAFDVQRTIARAIGTMRGSGDQVPLGILEMSNGNFERIARLLMEERASDGVWSAMQMMMDCSSGASAERRERIARDAASCLLGDTIDFPLPDLAEAWGAVDLGDDYRAPLRTEIPILFMVGDLDSRTPVSNAEELMVHMPNAKLIVVENAGHNDVPMGQPALMAAWSGFLRGKPVTIDRVTAPAIRFARPVREVSLTDAQLDAFVGRYSYGPMGTVTIARDGDAFTVTPDGQSSMAVRATSDHELRWVDFDAVLTLERDADGQFVRGTHEQGGRVIEVTRER